MSTKIFSFFAQRLADAVLEGEDPKEFLRGLAAQPRILPVKLDPANNGWAMIPVLDQPGRVGRFVNQMQLGPNPKPDLKERLHFLLRHRKGYRPGDIFDSPWGRFIVTDMMGLKEI